MDNQEGTTEIIDNGNSTQQLFMGDVNPSLEEEYKQLYPDEQQPEGEQEVPDGQPQESEQQQVDDSDEGTEENQQEQEETTLQEQIDKHEKSVKVLEKELDSKGVDFKALVKEYQENGNVSKETMEALDKAGYPKELVEGFIEGRQALERQFVSSVYEMAGGEKQYNELMQWASQHLPDKTINSYNRALDNNNLEAVSLMLEGIKARKVSQQGTRKKSFVGGASTSTPTTNKGFATKQDMINAMSDSRYGRDPVYTKEVENNMIYTKL